MMLQSTTFRATNMARQLMPPMSKSRSNGKPVSPLSIPQALPRHRAKCSSSRRQGASWATPGAAMGPLVGSHQGRHTPTATRRAPATLTTKEHISRAVRPRSSRAGSRQMSLGAGSTLG